MLVGIAACLVAAIIVSLSRMAFLATLLSGCLTALALIACHLRRGRMGAPAWRLGASALLVVLALILLPTKEMADRFVGSAAADNVSTQTRLDIWKDTLPMVGAYKWVGSGLGAYEVGLFPFKTVAPTNRIDFAHNDYLQILAELGAFGAALAFALAMWILWRALRAVLQGGAIRHWELAVGLLWALFAIGLHSFADFNLYIPANAFVLAWLSGVAASPALMERGPRIAF
jgi:O-antigen ligase